MSCTVAVVAVVAVTIPQISCDPLQVGIRKARGAALKAGEKVTVVTPFASQAGVVYGNHDPDDAGLRRRIPYVANAAGHGLHPSRTISRPKAQVCVVPP